MADLIKLYKACIEDAEQRYKETGCYAYFIIAKRLKKKIKKTATKQI